MITIHDVAKLAGVSIGTVSNVINQSNKVTPQTTEKVMDAIRSLNYIPNTLAKSLKTNQSKVIGIIAEDVRSFSSGDIIDGICAFFEKYDYAINLCNLRVNAKAGLSFSYRKLEESEEFKRSVKNAINILLTSRVCALIYIGTHPRNVSHILPKLDIPIVYTYAYTKNSDYCINYDDYQGAQLATEYLINMGHKKIAIICGSIDSVPSHKRMLGYQTALMEHNLSLYPEYVRTGNWHYEDGYNQCLELLKLKNPPTAIFSMSDLMAFGAINAAQDSGLHVPEDLSIHGFDNLEMTAYVRPELTTVTLPLFDLGFASAQTMLNVLNNNAPTDHTILIPCSHVIRNTVINLN